jgi:hypothetical protein
LFGGFSGATLGLSIGYASALDRWGGINFFPMVLGTAVGTIVGIATLAALRILVRASK